MNNKETDQSNPIKTLSKVQCSVVWEDEAFGKAATACIISCQAQNLVDHAKTIRLDTGLKILKWKVFRHLFKTISFVRE